MWEDFNNLEVLQGDPIQKWSEIMLNASPTLVTQELERLLELLATFEVAFEESGNDLRKFTHTHKEQIQAQMQNIAIESMAKILSENE
ncbi:DUF2018 family protein [Helicobacter fennelliae]|uniref:DUF2018 domain-containing protein n=2 Tax=Helicobacter fennelliae TaxID=215 RepID=T1DWW8_9HELI|nr:DUF2018 family protein [Helicobacter fennelliae]GAD19777.1 hypothetical protein HFN_1017 [Helicobacter fennelliae MRY12-0050]SQB98688.1 Domain of uncharacterised function (DUF2018) [Helicobacter fennelliae]STP08029.1 Domain of uncharacterised function (DUF2018) [Helicobacter fennelliae]STQ84062.1 Domain of uncharacterised function (DUF2018) [Helicobacter fennelliae]